MPIAGVVLWYNFLTNDSSLDDTIGWICFIVGFLGFFSSWITYGFGQLVEHVELIWLESDRAIANLTTEQPKSIVTKDGKWICGNCQAENNMNYRQCKKCGKFRG